MMRRPVLNRAAAAVVIGLVYFVAARLSLRLALVGESVTPLWPPTGIALVAFVWFGYRIWPGIALSAFLVNLPISPNAAAAAGIAAGNTLAPVIACALLRRLGFREELDRLRDALALVFAGALASMTLSATAGSLSLLASGAVTVDDFGSTWAVWWTGDAMGILAVAPFLLGLKGISLRRFAPLARVVEAGLLFVALAAASYSLQSTARPVWVVVFPLLGWAAWRFRQRGAGPAAVIVIVTATWAAAHDNGPFAGTGLLQKMVMLQVFNAAVAFTSFFFAAIVAERQRSIDREREAQSQLYEREHRIAETLQRSLLPEQLPDIPDLQAAARYIPASGDVEVGGDWYDVIAMHDGRLGIGIGDVAGHGVAAAAAMGQMRSAFRAYLLEGLSPAGTVERMNSLLRELLPGAMATLACAQLDPQTGALTIARAGHPPPLMLGPGGEVRLLEGGLAPPLGVIPLIGVEEAECELPLGSALFFYTDGLIERRRESFDQGLLRLHSALSLGPSDLDDACDRIVAALVGEDGVADDAVLLAVRRVELAGLPLHLSLPAQPERLAGIRRILGRWLRQNGSSAEEVADILVAATEACANVIQHAYDSKEGRMDIDATADGGVVTVGVRDFGGWMLGPSGPGDSNRGLVLMRGLMDSVDVFSGSDGTNIVMRRRVRGPEHG